jgi:hypothetical protein
MNNPNKKAGDSTRKMADKRRKLSISFIFIALCIAVILFLISTNQNLLIAIGPGGILIMLILLRVAPDFLIRESKKVEKLERRAIRGAVAEEKIGVLLEELGPDFMVIHDVNSRFGNIDHVVLGKDCGLILIETKAHGGTVTFQENTLLVNGKLPEKDFIQQTNNNTYWMRDQVSNLVGFNPWITSVIVFTNAFVKAYKPIKGVSVVNKKFLRAFIANKCKPSPQNLQIWDKREEINVLFLR